MSQPVFGCMEEVYLITGITGLFRTHGCKKVTGAKGSGVKTFGSIVLWLT